MGRTSVAVRRGLDITQLNDALSSVSSIIYNNRQSVRDSSSAYYNSDLLVSKYSKHQLASPLKEEEAEHVAIGTITSLAV